MQRADLVKMKINAQRLLERGDTDAAQVIDAIDEACPAEAEYVFVGFCPGAKVANRQDVKWKSHGICEFIFHQSKRQAKRFNQIAPGDLIILKKRKEIGRTMTLHGHGRVKAICCDDQNQRYLKVDWSKQDKEIEVPLIGANGTIDVRSELTVSKNMPPEFFDWLKV